jgi:hypothetical protein
MSSNSSTSSSETGSAAVASDREFSRLETAPRRRLPVAAIGLVCTVIIVEIFLSTRVGWFADQAAWQWREKKRVVDSGQLNGDVAVIGTSVLFHAVDAEEVNRLTKSPLTVTNLALNGMALHAQTQMLEDLLSQSAAPTAVPETSTGRIQHVLLELRHAVVEKKNWVSGPYFRQWARYSQFSISGFMWFEPSQSFSFAANRSLTSFAYRRSIDNFILDSGLSRGLTVDVLTRNREVSEEIEKSRGFCKASGGAGLTDSDVPSPQPRPWETNHAGLVWLHRLLALCEDHDIRVTLLQPPVPQFVQHDRDASQFDDDFQAFASKLQKRYPKTVAGIWAPSGYELTCFPDDHHLSYVGAERLTRDLAVWLDEAKPTP